MSTQTDLSHSIAALIGGTRFRYRNEIQLHDGIAALLASNGIEGLRREVRLSEHDRIDFLLGDLGIEVKVGGRHGDVWRQMLRYAQHDSIGALLLITTRACHVTGAPLEIDMKPVRIAVVGRRM